MSQYNAAASGLSIGVFQSVVPLRCSRAVIASGPAAKTSPSPVAGVDAVGKGTVHATWPRLRSIATSSPPLSGT